MAGIDSGAEAFLTLHRPQASQGVILGDGRQLACLAKISAFENVIQSATLLGEALTPNGVVITPLGAQSLTNTADARAIFKVRDPDLLFVTTFDELPAACKAATHLKALLPDIFRIQMVVLDTRGSDLYRDGVKLSAMAPFPPYQILRSTRTVAVMSPPETYTAWVIKIDLRTHLRSDPRQVELRPLRMMEAGLDPGIMVFSDPGIAPNHWAIQYNHTWKVNAMSVIGRFLPTDFADVPGLQTRTSSQVFPIIPQDQFSTVWEALAGAPDFFATPVKWWRGHDIHPTREAKVFEVYISQEKKVVETPHIFKTVIDVVRGDSPPASAFARRDFALHPVAANKWRMLAGPKVVKIIRQSLRSLKRDRGYRFKDEATGQYLDEVDDEGAGYASGVPPYWSFSDLATALSLPPDTTGERADFSLGDIRTTTWLIKGPGVQPLLDTMHHSQFDVISVSSAEAFRCLNSAALGSARGGGRPKEPRFDPNNQFGATVFEASRSSNITREFVTGDTSTPPTSTTVPPTTPNAAQMAVIDEDGVEELMD